MYSRSENNNVITFTEDVIEELSKRTGKSPELLREIYKTNLKYLHHSIRENTDILIVSFPNLGKMRFNYYLGLCSLASIRDTLQRAFIRKRVSLLRYILNFKGMNKVKNFNYPIVFTGVLYLNKTRENAIKSFYKNWSILEDKHNDNHAKYFKKS